MPEYKIVIESTDQPLEGSLKPKDIETATKNKLTEEQKKDQEEREKLGNTILDAIGKVQSGVEAARFIASPLVQTVGQTYQLQGETLKATRLDNQYTQINTAIDMTLQAATGSVMAAMGNPMMLASTAMGLAQQAYQLALQNRAFYFKKNLDNYRSRYLSQRLVKNISEVR